MERTITTRCHEFNMGSRNANVKKHKTVHTVGLSEKQRLFLDRNLASQGMASQHFDTLDELLKASPDLIIASSQKYTKEIIRQACPGLDAEILCVRFPNFDAPPFVEDSPPPGGLAAVLTGFDMLPPLEEDNPWIKRPL